MGSDTFWDHERSPYENLAERWNDRGSADFTTGVVEAFAMRCKENPGLSPTDDDPTRILSGEEELQPDHVDAIVTWRSTYAAATVAQKTDQPGSRVHIERWKRDALAAHELVRRNGELTVHVVPAHEPGKIDQLVQAVDEITPDAIPIGLAGCQDQRAKDRLGLSMRRIRRVSPTLLPGQNILEGDIDENVTYMSECFIGALCVPTPEVIVYARTPDIETAALETLSQWAEPRDQESRIKTYQFTPYRKY